MQPGSIVTLREDIHSGLEVKVLIYAVKLTEGLEVSSCTAVGLSSFNQEDSVYTQRIKDSPNGLKGDKGDDGESFTVSITSSNGSVFRSGMANTTLTCHVFRNTDEITDTLEDWRFMWKRESGDSASDLSWANKSKAMGHKSVRINAEDCLGRAVFFCEVEIGEI